MTYSVAPPRTGSPPRCTCLQNSKQTKKSHKSVVIFLNSLAIRLTSVDEIIGVDEMDVATLEIADADQCRTDLIALADLHLGLGSSVEYQTHHRHFNGDQLPLQSIEIVKN